MIISLSFSRFMYLIAGLMWILSCKSTQPVMKTDPVQPIYSLERTGCLGNCPVYSLKIYSDRSIHLNARRDLPVTGVFSDTLSERELQDIQEALELSRFSTWDTLYDAKILDAPFIKIGVDQEGTWKTVHCRGEEPENFEMLLSALEATMSTRGWLADEKNEIKEMQEVILHLQSDHDVAAIEQKYVQYGLKLKKKISPRQNFFLFSTDPSSAGDYQLISLLKEDEMVIDAQWNHTLKKRK